MTKEQFETTGFHRSMKVEYRSKEYYLLAVDFDAETLELSEIDPKSGTYIDDEDRISAFFYLCDIISKQSNETNH